MKYRNAQSGFVTAAQSNQAAKKASCLQVPDIDYRLLELYMRENHPELLSKKGKFKGYPKKLKQFTAKNTRSSKDYRDKFYKAASEEEIDSINTILSNSANIKASNIDSLDDFLIAKAYDLAADIIIQQLNDKSSSLKKNMFDRLAKELESFFGFSNEIRKSASSASYVDVILDLHMKGDISYNLYVSYKNLTPNEFVIKFMHMIINAIDTISKDLKHAQFEKSQFKQDTRSWGEHTPQIAYRTAINRVFSILSPSV